MLRNLYSLKEYFLLRISGVEYLIDEPLNWDKVTSKAKRDGKFYGFNADFIDGEVQLIFAYAEGGNELEAAYDSAGADALVQLEFGIQTTANRTRQYLGNVNMNTKVERVNGIECTVERVAFESLLRTRYNTKVSLNTSSSYDNEPIPSINALTLQLHSKNIIKVTEARTTFPQKAFLDVNASGTTYGYSMSHYIQPDTTQGITDELEDVIGLPFDIYDHAPVADQRYQYRPTEAGRLEIFFDWFSQGGIYNVSPNVIASGIDGMFEPDIPYGANDNVWNAFVWQERGGEVIKRISKPALNSGRLPTPNTFFLDVEKNDQIYVGIEVVHKFLKKGAYSDTWQNTVRFKQQTVAPSSICYGYKVFDFLNHLVAVLTGKPGRVLSQYYGPGGPAEKRAITSGYSIRNFDVQSDKPVQAEFGAALDSLQAIDNIGVGFKTIPDVNGEDQEYIFIEPMSYFYRNGVIAIIREAYDWSEAHDQAHTYNQVKIGYSKYPALKANTLDEYNTEQEYLLPVKTYKNTLTAKSDFIASGYLIEEQRREQFKANPSTSLDNDDSLFIICYVDSVVFPDMAYEINAVSQTVTFGRPIGLIVGDLINIAGQTAGVTGINYGQPNSYTISGSYVTVTGTAPVTVTTPSAAANNVTAYAERNQYFDKVENVLDPGSAYNLRLTPHKNLYNFAPLLNMGMEYKSDTDYIINTFSKNNGNLISRLMPGAPFPGLAGNREIIERGDILLSDYERSSKLFTGRLMGFKCRLPYDTAELIKQGMRDELQDVSKNCGCIVAPDRKGALWVCSIESMNYNYVTTEAEFAVNKKELY